MTEFADLLKNFETEENHLRNEPKALILVVDDDESIRRGLGSVFSHKYEVLTSECGRDREVLQTSEDVGAQILHENKNLLQPIGNMLNRTPPTWCVNPGTRLNF